MAFKENIISLLDRRSRLFGFMIPLAVMSIAFERDREFNLLILSGLASTTLLRDHLIEQSEKHARAGAVRRAYLEATGAGLASTFGKTTLGVVLSNGILEGRLTAAVGITAATIGLIDSMQNIRNVSRIVKAEHFDLPPVYWQ